MIRNFSEAHAALRRFYGPTNTGMPYTLDRIRALLAYVGNPQDTLRVVHVAGTSGKTSTAYYVSALLEASGAKVGLTVSPHVDEVNERVQINHMPLPEAAFGEALAAFLGLVDASGIRPSYFELMVAFAYWEFARQHVDYAVIEVGLGGLLDGTNVVGSSDKVCIITDIGLDHTEVLGDTLGEIATQKAGIIQPQNHVFMYEQGQEVMLSVTTRCNKQNAVLTAIHPGIAAPSKTTELPLFQQRNFFLALQAVTYILARDHAPALSDTSIEQAAHAYVPARMEIIKIGDKTVIIDGSHNGQKLMTLVESIQAKFPGQRVAAVVSFVDGPAERWQRAIDALHGMIDEIIITSFNAEQDVPKRSVDPAIVAAYCVAASFRSVTVERDPREAFKALQQLSAPVLLVAGSFYLLNDIRPLVITKERAGV